jgi:DNA-binding transcriptional ArsR family regulator
VRPGATQVQRRAHGGDDFAPVQILRIHNGSMAVTGRQRFAYHQSMDVDALADLGASRIAGAIGEPARARMLYCLSDGHARTATELAMVAGVTPSTASIHLSRLKTDRLVKVHVQGKHHYYTLQVPNVARVLEGLSVLAGGPRGKFVPNTPGRLRAARTCYDHIAGTLGVSLHGRVQEQGWIDSAYDLTAKGEPAFAAFGIDVQATRARRRRFAFACLDWSERRPHLGGALGAALLSLALKRKWVLQDLDSRVLTVTSAGRREMQARFGIAG